MDLKLSTRFVSYLGDLVFRSQHFILDKIDVLYCFGDLGFERHDKETIAEGAMNTIFCTY